MFFSSPEQFPKVDTPGCFTGPFNYYTDSPGPIIYRPIPTDKHF